MQQLTINFVIFLLLGNILKIVNAAVCKQFLLMHRPSSNNVVYTCLPGKYTRIVFNDPNVAIKKIAVDNLNNRLFMIDYANNRIVWTQLAAHENGKLMTDGQLRTAIDSFGATAIATDPKGALYFSGVSTYVVFFLS